MTMKMLAARVAMMWMAANFAGDPAQRWHGQA
jgi:hypothetical protein